jgi:alpha-D-xyloside xylohydrolase
LPTASAADIVFPVHIDTTLGNALPLSELTCRLTFPAQNAVRVQVGPALTGSAAEDASGVWAERTPGGGMLARTAEMAVTVDPHPMRLRLEGPDGEQVVDVAVQRRPPLGEFELIVSADPQARVYGCGEKFNGTDQRGQVVHNWSVDMITSKYADSYAPVPWFMTTDGYGLLLNNRSASIFDFRAAGRRAYEIRTQAFYVTGLATWMGFDAPELDFTLFYGPGLRRIQQTYVEVAGRPYFMPEWSYEPLMGPAWPREFTPDVVDEYLEQLDALELPHRILYFDNSWERAAGDLTFKHFDDPKALIDRIHERGYKVVLWTAPWLSIPSAIADEARERGYILMQAGDPSQPYVGRPVLGGYSIDFTNPEARDWYKQRIRHVLEWGVDGFFADFGEADDIRNARFADGEIGVSAGEAYTVLYHQALYEACHEVRGDDVYLISRSGWTGIQRYAGLCSGDQGTSFDYMPVIMNGIQSAGLSGMPFVSHCLGGYAGDHAKGPYLRWVQMGVFGPLFSIWNHGGVRTEPWSFDDDEVVEIYRRYANLRSELMPHVTSYARRASETGLPMVQALRFAFEDDEASAGWEDEYLFGEELLVAPIYTDSGLRDVYLPACARWYDFWTGAEHAGGTTLTVDAPLDVIPVYVREGAIVATEPRAEPDSLVASVWPGRSGRLELFRHGASATIRMHADGDRTVIEADPVPHEALWLRLPRAGEPSSVARDGRELSRHERREATGERGWCVEDGTLWIRVPGSLPGSVAIAWAPQS